MKGKEKREKLTKASYITYRLVRLDDKGEKSIFGVFHIWKSQNLPIKYAP